MTQQAVYQVVYDEGEKSKCCDDIVLYRLKTVCNLPSGIPFSRLVKYCSSCKNEIGGLQ